MNPWKTDSCLPFLRTIAEENDDASRLIFCDFLEESGVHEWDNYAHFIRHQVKVSNMTPCNHNKRAMPEICDYCRENSVDEQFIAAERQLSNWMTQDIFSNAITSFAWIPKRGIPHLAGLYVNNSSELTKALSVMPTDLIALGQSLRVLVLRPNAECPHWQFLSCNIFSDLALFHRRIHAKDRLRLADFIASGVTKYGFINLDEVDLVSSARKQWMIEFGCHNHYPNSFDVNMLVQMPRRQWIWGNLNEPIGTTIGRLCAECRDKNPVKMIRHTKTLKRAGQWRTIHCWHGQCDKCQRHYLMVSPSFPQAEKWL